MDWVDRDFRDFLEGRGIKLSNCRNEVPFNFDIEEVKKQLMLIKSFHESSIGYNPKISKSIKNDTGKLVEDFKMDIKRLKKYAATNEDEIADSMILRAQKAVDLIYEGNYYNLLKRSMDRTEICLGNPFSDNLWIEDKVCVADINECSFNMVEVDAACFLNKIKKKNSDLPITELAGFFCETEGLDIDSKNYIIAVLSFPDEYMRCFRRYYVDKKAWTPHEYKIRIKKSIIRDGASLI